MSVAITREPPPSNELLAALAFAVLVASMLAAHGCSASQQRTEAAVTIVAAGAGVTALQLASHESYRAATDALMAAGTVGAAYDVATRPIDAEFRARGQAIQVLARTLDVVAHRVDDPNAPLDVVGTLEIVDLALAVLARGAVLPPLAIPPEITNAAAALRVLAGPR